MQRKVFKINCLFSSGLYFFKDNEKIMTLAVFICERNDEIGLKKFVWYLFIFN